MQLSQDSKNLVNKNFFAVAPVPTEVTEALLKNAQDHLAACKLLQAHLPIPAFSVAFESLSQLCEALCEHYDVQVKTNTAIPAICRELGMNSSDRSLVSTIDERRNLTSYQPPSPAVLRYETEILIRLLETYIPIAYRTLKLPH